MVNVATPVTPKVPPTVAFPDNVASPEAANVENAPVLAEFAPIGVPSIAPLSILILVVAYPPKSETPSRSIERL